VQSLISQESSNQAESEPKLNDRTVNQDQDGAEDFRSDRSNDQDESEPPEPELPPEPDAPAPNAWEVWTYLERERQKTLTCVGTFTTEWEASRFVDAAERKNSGRLRIHYEIHPIVIPSDDDNVESESPEQTSEQSNGAAKTAEPEAIDVEVLVEERDTRKSSKR
jgi:hypothetical protein